MTNNAPIQIVDCTLREGEQTAGVWFTVEEKLELVDALAQVGVRWLDAGMPAVSADERAFLRAATGRTEARIGASVRAVVEECQLAIDCGCDEIFVICPVSPLHRTQRLGMDEAALRRRIEAVVQTIVRSGRTCNMVAEDASRTDPIELQQLLETALNAGADRLFLCDTVGHWTPSGAKEAFETLRAELGDVPLGVHCHNDFGMATANTIAAIEGGCTWPTTTVNGVGERAGNASLLEVAAACDRLMNRPTSLQLDALTAISKQVEHLTGFLVSQHQPLVGWNAFRHESGIHIDGLIKDTTTYEGVDPDLLGREHRYVVGKHSGTALLRRYAASHDWPDDDETLGAVLDLIKSRRPDWVRESFVRLRQHIDRYNETCLGVPETHLGAFFDEALGRKKTGEKSSG
jgi:isopropylmalate/homocitrate/citramalate synthase